MSQFTFKKAGTAFNAVKFLWAIVSQTGQNNPNATHETSHVLTGATFQEASGDATGSVQYEGPQNGKDAFQQMIQNSAKNCGSIKVTF